MYRLRWGRYKSASLRSRAGPAGTLLSRSHAAVVGGHQAKERGMEMSRPTRCHP